MTNTLREKIESKLNSVFCMATGDEYDEYLNGPNDAEEILEEVIKEVEGMKVDGIELPMGEYLPIVKSGNMDKMFDYGYKEAKQDLIDKLGKD
jgi:hypothetical protein